MPQPLKDPVQTRWVPLLLLQRPKHAARIGLVAAEWAMLEQELIHIFAFALRSGDAMFVALQTLDVLSSLQAKLDVIKAISVLSIPPDMHQEFVTELIPEIRRRAGERNTVIHGHWVICDDYPEDIVLKPLTEQPMRYILKDFEDVVDRIVETRNKLTQFMLRMPRPDPFPPGLRPKEP